MASVRASITMARPRNEIPQNFDSLADIEGLYRHGTDLASLSRRGWLSDVIEQLCRRYDVRGLAYLGKTAVVLDPETVRVAVRMLKLLIERIDADPSHLYDLTGQGAFEVADVRSNLAGPADLAGPPHDEGDGDDLLYLAWFLRAQLAQLEGAQSCGHVVMYAQTREDAGDD
jgi:hypothetical protein